jgi:hypothetical protein
MKLPLLLAAAAVCAPATASADIRVADMQSVAAALAGAHASDVQLKSAEGTPWIAARFASGLKYVAEFYECDASGAECERVSLGIGFLETGADVADLNPWNQTRFPQAFIDNEGDPILQHYTIAPEPYGAASLQVLLEFWEGECRLFRDFVYEAGSRTKVRAPSARSGAPNAAAPVRLTGAIGADLKNSPD